MFGSAFPRSPASWDVIENGKKVDRRSGTGSHDGLPLSLHVEKGIEFGAVPLRNTFAIENGDGNRECESANTVVEFLLGR